MIRNQRESRSSRRLLRLAEKRESRLSAQAGNDRVGSVTARRSLPKQSHDRSTFGTHPLSPPLLFFKRGGLASRRNFGDPLAPFSFKRRGLGDEFVYAQIPHPTKGVGE